MEPLGIGTSMTESLTSYIVRLAEAHSVTVGDFVGRLLSKIPNPKGTLLTRAALEFRAGGHGFHACGYRINGNSGQTAKWVDALETATGRSDLRYLLMALAGAGTVRFPDGSPLPVGEYPLEVMLWMSGYSAKTDEEADSWLETRYSRRTFVRGLRRGPRRTCG
ncbi:MAG TPA: hypothetical protein VFI20_04335 [Terracidiphilus sp.]|nr:hypothetical protein [Terracidiphilus sp.]